MKRLKVIYNEIMGLAMLYGGLYGIYLAFTGFFVGWI